MIEIKLPKKIKVGGLTYRVKIVKDQSLKADHLWGKTISLTQEMLLEVEAPPERFSEAFIHELIHTVDAIYLGDRLKEEDIIPLANGLHQALESMGVRFVKP